LMNPKYRHQRVEVPVRRQDGHGVVVAATMQFMLKTQQLNIPAQSL